MYSNTKKRTQMKNRGLSEKAESTPQFGTARPGTVLLHIDGDAFFASVYQATHAEARGKPVIIGRERSIATAFSYEAKRKGVKRGMLISEAKKICPEAIVVTSDYRTYQQFSSRMVDIAASYSPKVETYSIDEVFVNLTGYDKVHNTSYEKLGRRIKEHIEKALGLTVSAGLASTKTLTKIGSSFDKPSGYVTIDRHNTRHYLEKTPVEDIWGIGNRLAIRLKQLGYHDAYTFSQAPRTTIEKHFNKLVLQTWYELRGESIYNLEVGRKTTYKSIRKTKTVTPPTSDPDVLYSRILHHIERAFSKARKYNYRVGKLSIFLKTQKFTYKSTNISLPQNIAYPYLIRRRIRKAFQKVYTPETEYRASGCTLTDLEKNTSSQPSLFNTHRKLEKKLDKIYPLYENNKISFGSDLFEPYRHKRKKKFKTVGLESVS